MTSFEDVGVVPELIEALAAAGIERPTALQEAAIPVVRRGNNLVMVAGPGSGTLVAWSIPLLERIAPDGDAPKVLVLTPTEEAATRLAESLALHAAVTAHTVAALGSPWALPGRAHFLFATPPALLAAMARGDVAVGAAEAVVLTQADAIAELHGLDAVEQVLDSVPSEAQRLVAALPLTPAVADFVTRHVKRATTVPPQQAIGTQAPAARYRGRVEYVVAVGGVETVVLDVVRAMLEDVRHVLLFCRSDDRAADLGDHLTLHGYVAGAPGDETVPVWLGVDALAARAAVDGREGVRVLSADVPTDPDELDRRHGIASGGVIVVLPREIPHLHDVAERTGYETAPHTVQRTRSADGIARLRERIERALSEEDVSAYLLALEPLFERHHAAEVAAAAAALLRRAAVAPAGPRAGAAPSSATATPAATPSWAKLFVSVGSRDGLKPGDLVGAITGEADVPGDAVGRIEIRESHSVVEVHDAVAKSVIRALNGTTIKGRAARVDFDRPRRRAPAGGPPRRGGPGSRGRT